MNPRDRLLPRFWSIKDKEYIYWDCYMQTAFNRLIEPNTYGLMYNLYKDSVNYVSEMPTGLRDKKGRLIYEGDIVKIIDKSSRKEPFIGVVEYTNTASFEANCNGFYMHLHNPKTPENVSMIEKMFCTSLREIEIIGNIHENKELLNG